MFEFNPDLVQGDDQEAGDDGLLYTHREEEEREGVEGEEENGDKVEGRDITDTTGYSDEVLPPPPPPVVQSSVGDTTSQAESASGLIQFIY